MKNCENCLHAALEFKKEPCASCLCGAWNTYINWEPRPQPAPEPQPSVDPYLLALSHVRELLQESSGFDATEEWTQGWDAAHTELETGLNTLEAAHTTGVKP